MRRCRRCGCKLSQYGDQRLAPLCAPCGDVAPCRVCNGRGVTIGERNLRETGHYARPCYRCGGHGRAPQRRVLPDRPHTARAKEECTVCRGRGYMGKRAVRKPCYRCGGSGVRPPSLLRPHTPPGDAHV